MVVAPPESYSHCTVPPSEGVTDVQSGLASAVPHVAATASVPIASDAMRDARRRGRGRPFSGEVHQREQARL